MQMRFIRYLYSSEDNLFDLLCLIGTISGSDLQALQQEADTLPKKDRLAVALLASSKHRQCEQASDFVSEVVLGVPHKNTLLQDRLGVDLLCSLVGQLNLGLALRGLLCGFLISLCTPQ